MRASFVHTKKWSSRQIGKKLELVETFVHIHWLNNQSNLSAVRLTSAFLSKSNDSPKCQKIKRKEIYLLSVRIVSNLNFHLSCSRFSKVTHQQTKTTIKPMENIFLENWNRKVFVFFLLSQIDSQTWKVKDYCTEVNCYSIQEERYDSTEKTFPLNFCFLFNQTQPLNVSKFGKTLKKWVSECAP